MKINHPLLFVLLALFLFSACSEQDDTPASDAVEASLLETFERNSILLDTAFGLTIQVVNDNGGIAKLVKSAKTEDEFLEAMEGLTKETFHESIEVLRQPLSLGSASYRNTEVSWDRLSNLTLNPSVKEPLYQYADELEFDASNKDQDSWIAIESGDADVLVRYSSVLELLEVFDLIMKHSDTQQLDNAIDDLTTVTNSRVLMGLLLPAVQKVREAASRLRKLHDLAFSNDLTIVSPRTGYEKELRAAGFLGGLDLLVDGDFQKANGNQASIEVLHMIYLNTTFQLWHQTWNEYH